MSCIRTRGKKGVPHPDPADPPRRRANRRPGHAADNRAFDAPLAEAARVVRPGGVVILTPDHYSEIHMPVKRAFAAAIAPAFIEADSVRDSGRMVPIAQNPALLRRFPDLALAVPFEEVGFRAFHFIYGLRSLAVTW